MNDINSLDIARTDRSCEIVNNSSYHCKCFVDAAENEPSTIDSLKGSELDSHACPASSRPDLNESEFLEHFYFFFLLCEMLRLKRKTVNQYF